MALAVKKEEGNRFFVIINQFFKETFFVITTNKSPAEWAKSLDDETLTTDLLVRLLYKYQFKSISREHLIQNYRNLLKVFSFQ